MMAEEDPSFALAYAMALRHSVVELVAEDGLSPVAQSQPYVDSTTLATLLVVRL
jgi:hypothetical protein